MVSAASETVEASPRHVRFKSSVHGTALPSVFIVKRQETDQFAHGSRDFVSRSDKINISVFALESCRAVYLPYPHCFLQWHPEN